MLHLLVSIFTSITLLIAAFGLGRPMLRWIGVSEDDVLSSVVFGLGLGMLIVGLFLLALGQAGILSTPVVGLLTLPCCCWGLAEIAILCLRPSVRSSTVFQRLPNRLPPPSNTLWPEPPRWLLAVCFVLAGVGCLASLVNALTPLTTDVAFCGPLESAKRFLVEQRIAVQGARGPWLVEMWYVWALAVGDGVSVQLIHWSLGILLSLAAVTLATPLVGRRWAWLSGCLVMVTPAVNQQLSVPVESVALAVFCTLALTAWWRAVCHGAEGHWFIVAGLMAGGALGISHSALLMILAVTITWVWSVCRHAEQSYFLLHGGFVAAAFAAGVGVLCHPPAVWSADSLHDLSSFPPSSFSLFDHLGLLLLAAVPGVLLVRRLRGLGVVLWSALIYVSVIFLLGYDAWLLVATVPLLSVAAVWVVMELRRFPRAACWAAAAALASLAVCDMALPLVQFSNNVPLALGFEDREEFLLQREPTYRAATVANRILRPNDHILSQERQSFYFNCRVTSESLLDRSFDVEDSRCSTREAVERLRREGFTHLLLTKNVAGEPSAKTSPLHRLADAGLTLTDYDFRTADGGVRRYRLVQLR